MNAPIYGYPPTELYPDPQLELNRELANAAANGWLVEHLNGNEETAKTMALLFHDLLLGRYDS